MDSDGDAMIAEHLISEEEDETEIVNKGDNDENTILLPVANPSGEEAITENDILQCDTPQSDPMEEDALEEVAIPKRRGRKPKNNVVATLATNNISAEKSKSPVMRTPTQVPKKRRDAVTMAAIVVEPEEVKEEYEIEEVEEEEEIGETEKVAPEEKPTPKRRGRKPGFRPNLTKKKVENDTEPQPTTSKKSSKDDVVLEDQCRVCMATEDLLSLFKKVDAEKTVADLLMLICPSVSIARKDFMPQYICKLCLEHVNVACELRQKCESTEKELRSRLSRSKNKIRRPALGYIVVDAPDSDGQSEPNDEPDDNDFKISEGSKTPEDDDDDDSDDFNLSRKSKRRTVTRSRRGRRKSSLSVNTPNVTQNATSRNKIESSIKAKKRMGRPSKIQTEDISKQLSDDNADDEIEEEEYLETNANSGDDFSPPKKKRSTSTKSPPQTEFPCDECDQVFTKKTSLALHRKVHIKTEPLKCQFCGKEFKQHASYKAHVTKHEQDTQMKCTQCEKFFTTKTERRRHMVEVHDEPSATHACDKCKRSFTSEQRLIKHKESRCPGYEIKTHSKKSENETTSLGKDLFKAVAPLTTTYWSDSFSD